MPICVLVPFLPLDVTPEKTIQTFVAAFNARRPDAARQVVGGRRFVFPKGANIPTLNVVVGKTTVTGDSAKVEADTTFTGGKGHETVDLRRVGGDWRIVPADPKAVGMAETKYVGFLAYSVVHPEILTMAKTAAKKTVCLSNVKQLALGTMMYESDHDDVLPKSSAGWKAAIMPYVKSEKIFHCPLDASGRDSYFLDPRVAGLSMGKIANPAETAMIVEGTPKKTAFRHGGTAALGFTDGHAKMVRPADMTKARTVKLK